MIVLSSINAYSNMEYPWYDAGLAIQLANQFTSRHWPLYGIPEEDYLLLKLRFPMLDKMYLRHS